MKRVNGIPILGFGTYPLSRDEADRAISTALELGFRHVDTAQMYGNEAEVGRVLERSGIARTDLFIVTKVDPGNVGADRFLASVERSIAHLNGPVDLLLIHWPPSDKHFDKAVDLLIDAKERGFCRAIGVSNFTIAMMQRAQARAANALIANQVEFHPLIDQARVKAEADRLGMALMAYCPLGRGEAMKKQGHPGDRLPIEAAGLGSRPRLDHAAECRGHPDDDEARQCGVEFTVARSGALGCRYGCDHGVEQRQPAIDLAVGLGAEVGQLRVRGTIECGAFLVIPGLVPGNHCADTPYAERVARWIAGTSPPMTSVGRHRRELCGGSVNV